MKHKRIILLPILLFSCMLNAQIKLQKADDAYQRLQYVKASNKYEKLKKTKHNSPQIRLQLANCYYYMGEIQKAWNNYQTVDLEAYPQNELYNYLQTAKATQDSVLIAQITVLLCEKFDNTICKESSINSKIAYFDVSETNLNTAENNVFGAYLLNENTLLFLSDKNKRIGSKNGYNNRGFFDIYRAEKVDEYEFTNFKKLNGDANSKYNEGQFCFTPDGKHVYLTRNQQHNTSADVYHLGIYIADISPKGKWKNVRNLSINDPNYSNAHPTLSPDGKKMIFASNMDGGYGGMDLYIADVLEDGDVVEAQNIGKAVNTSRNELFPWIDNHQHLYFASDGHNGFGGLDIFVATINNNKIEKIINCGANINSPHDDFAFILNQDGKTGYMSSNRTGTDNIYAVNKIKEIEQQTMISGKITSSDSKTPIKNTEIELVNGKVKQKMNVKIDSLGNYTFLLPDSISKNDHLSYQLEIKKMGYATKKIPLEQFISDTIINIDLRQLSRNEHLQEISIHFQQGSAQIQEESKIALQKVIDMLIENPSMTIEVAAHTDCTSSKAFNIRLSKKRANACVKYIRERIPSPQQIYGKGYGKAQPIINCNCDSKTQTPCSPEDMQTNRRAEFIIKHL